MSTHMERLARARESLEGLSVGDAFGETFFYWSREGVVNRMLAEPEWPWTDDTNMALSIYALLSEFEEIDQDELAANFAENFDPGRGYGSGAYRLMLELQAGADWRRLAPALFGGQGSYGNGAAMRIAPLGAYFADDLDACVENARRASEVTHAHPDGIAGGIAVAVAVAVAWNCRGEAITRPDFIDRVLPHIPQDTDMYWAVQAARDTSAKAVNQAVARLGNGSDISAVNTVPFALWCAGEHLYDYEEALWQTASAGGDVDTTCAIVGGIVAAHLGDDAIPDLWLEYREPLPDWPFTMG